MYMFLAAAIEDTQNLESFENEKSLSGNFEGWCCLLEVKLTYVPVCPSSLSVGRV